jgi:tRNA isopentenyl-2-thiomethyl-A-37 hydroxylase MiaE
MNNANLNQKRIQLHEISAPLSREDQNKSDIIVMKQVKDGDDRYVFYLVDRECQLTATQKEIEAMAKYHHAKISYFPTTDPAIMLIRKLVKECGTESQLFNNVIDILKKQKERIS